MRDRPMPPVLVLARRMIRTTLREKSYRMGFVTMLILVIVGVAAVGLFSERDRSFEVAVVDDVGHTVVTTTDEALAAAEDRPGGSTSLSAVRTQDSADAKGRVAAGEADAALVPHEDGGWLLIGHREVDPLLETALGGAVQATVLAELALQQQADPAMIAQSATVTTQLLEGSAANGVSTTVLRLIFGFLFASSLLTFGLAIAQGVVEEKDSRVVEILAASVSTRSMLVSKILANVFLGTVQVIVLVGVALGGLWLVGILDDMGQVVTGAVGFVVFYVLGFLAVSCVWAALGAMASKPDDLATSAVPVQILVFGGYFLSFIAPPWLLAASSYVPVVSSLTMPTRLMTGSAQWWEPPIAAALVVLFGLLALGLSIRAYDRTLLRTDRRTNWREIFRGRTRPQPNAGSSERVPAETAGTRGVPARTSH